MASDHRRILLALAVAVSMLTAACAEPVIPVVTAPEVPTATSAPTATPLPTVAAAPTATPAPFEGEPGLTAESMRIAVISDSPAGLGTDEVGEEVWQAIEAWAAAVNAAGGLSNRVVVVERIDASVFRHAEAIDLVCNGDFFAVVGSWAVNDDEGLDQLASPGCSLPDFPARASKPDRLASDITFVSNAVNGDVRSAGAARYFAEAQPEAVARAGTLILELPATAIEGQRMIEAATAQGYTFVHRPVVPIDIDLADAAEAVVDADVRALVWSESGARLLEFLDAVAEVDPEYEFDLIDCQSACYDPVWVDAAGARGVGVSVSLPVLPTDEADVAPELARYLFFVTRTHGEDALISPAGLQAWSAALLFEEAVNRAIGLDTPDYDPAALTRGRVVDAARTITEWDALGLQGSANPAEGIPSPCVVVLTLTRAGAWERRNPERRGAFDCDPENLVSLQVTLGEDFAEPTATPAADDDTPPDEDG